VRLGNIEVPDLQTWLRSRRNRWEDLRYEYEGRKRCSVEELIEMLNDCEALAGALERSDGASRNLPQM